MKKLMVIATVAAAVTLASGEAMAQIAGTSHDFTSGHPQITFRDLASSQCESCHFPHGAAEASLGPLWNHAPSTAVSWTPYSSVTLEVPAGTQPGPVSRLCLGCHDGTVAVDAYGGTTVRDEFITSDLPTYIGTDLSDDHPVGVDYANAFDSEALSGANGLADDGGAGVVGSSNLPLYAGGTEDAQLECPTCHNPHGTPNEPFLRHAVLTICSQCHNK